MKGVVVVVAVAVVVVEQQQAAELCCHFSFVAVAAAAAAATGDHRRRLLLLPRRLPADLARLLLLWRLCLPVSGGTARTRTQAALKQHGQTAAAAVAEQR